MTTEKEAPHDIETAFLTSVATKCKTHGIRVLSKQEYLSTDPTTKHNFSLNIYKESCHAETFRFQYMVLPFEKKDNKLVFSSCYPSIQERQSVVAGPYPKSYYDMQLVLFV